MDILVAQLFQIVYCAPLEHFLHQMVSALGPPSSASIWPQTVVRLQILSGLLQQALPSTKKCTLVEWQNMNLFFYLKLTIHAWMHIST